tara:strand:+ start:7057 stop:7737 length:681 start_codon:yes stop_codon:yes gene_type:complete
MLDYLKESHKKTQNRVQDFYTAAGIHVYIKDPLPKNVDIEEVIASVEQTIPSHLLSEVEMIIVGWFEEFEKRQLNAFYSDGCLHITNEQDNADDMIDDIIHEVSHSLEEPHGFDIYGDKKLEHEFLTKRMVLHQILWARGFKAPEAFFTDLEYNLEFDNFLLNKVGYDKLALLVDGLFLSAYAPTSLREYFATGFTDFFMDPDHSYFRVISPELYKKIAFLHKNDK